MAKEADRVIAELRANRDRQQVLQQNTGHELWGPNGRGGYDPSGRPEVTRGFTAQGNWARGYPYIGDAAAPVIVYPNSPYPTMYVRPARVNWGEMTAAMNAAMDRQAAMMSNPMFLSMVQAAMRPRAGGGSGSSGNAASSADTKADAKGAGDINLSNNGSDYRFIGGRLCKCQQGVCTPVAGTTASDASGTGTSGSGTQGSGSLWSFLNDSRTKDIMGSVGGLLQQLPEVIRRAVKDKVSAGGMVQDVPQKQAATPVPPVVEPSISNGAVSPQVSTRGRETVRLLPTQPLSNPDLQAMLEAGVPTIGGFSKFALDSMREPSGAALLRRGMGIRAGNQPMLYFPID